MHWRVCAVGGRGGRGFHFPGLNIWLPPSWRGMVGWRPMGDWLVLGGGRRGFCCLLVGGFDLYIGFGRLLHGAFGRGWVFCRLIRRGMVFLVKMGLKSGLVGLGFLRCCYFDGGYVGLRGVGGVGVDATGSVEELGRFGYVFCVFSIGIFCTEIYEAGFLPCI